MKYNKEERLDIGRQIYERELTMAAAATKYDVSLYTARDYLRLYKASENKSWPKMQRAAYKEDEVLLSRQDIEQYEHMSKEELMEELIKAKIEAALAKKRNSSVLEEIED